MSPLLASARADALRLRRWPTVWVLIGIWLLLNVMFVYVFRYLSYRNGTGAFAEGTPRAELLAGVLPDRVPLSIVQGMPMFGGAIILTLGALAAGSGYGWGTWKTALTQGPSRLAVAGGTVVALAGLVLTVIAVTLLVDLGVASVLAMAEGQPLGLPAIGALARAIGCGILILGMWALAGATIGTLARSPALAVGLGVVWVLAIENLLRGVASLLDWLRPVIDVLPGTAAGSLVASLGATPVSEGGSPGVVNNLAGWPAAGVVLGYLLVFMVCSGLLVRRRDVV
jgi:ABC-2 type transport system permease protein